MNFRKKLKAFLASLISLAMIFSCSLSASATQVLVATIATPGTNPLHAAVSQDGRNLYVIEVDTPNRLLVINTSTNEVTNSTVLSSTQGTTAMVLSPDGLKLYILDGTGKNVDIVHLGSGTPTIGASISLSSSGNYRSIAGSPDGQRLYVANAESGVNSVFAIDTATNTVAAEIPSPLSGADQLTTPSVMVVSPDNSILYVSYYGISTTARRGVASFTFDSSSDTYTARHEIAWTSSVKPNGLALSSDGQRLYMTNEQSSNNSSLYVFRNPSAGFTDVNNPSPISTGGSSAKSVALSADDSLLYLAHGGSGGGKLNVYSTANLSSVTTLVLPSATLWNIAPSKTIGSNFAYVATTNDVYLVGEYLSPNWQVLSGNTGVTLTSSALTASGISGTLTYSVAPALPAGFSLDSATGVISGSSSSALTETTYTITGTDGSTSAVATVTLSVSAPTPPATTTPAVKLATTGNDLAPFSLGVTSALLISGLMLLTASKRLRRKRL